MLRVFMIMAKVKRNPRGERAAANLVCLRLESGFTLVEVLIAAVILFSALALGLLAYRTSISTLDRVTANVRIADALPSIMAKVKTGVLERKTRGEGRYGESVAYLWNAREIKASKNIINPFDEATGRPLQGTYKITLHNILLKITYEKDGRNKETEYEYQELSWFK